MIVYLFSSLSASNANLLMKALLRFRFVFRILLTEAERNWRKRREKERERRKAVRRSCLCRGIGLIVLLPWLIVHSNETVKLISCRVVACWECSVPVKMEDEKNKV